MSISRPCSAQLPPQTPSHPRLPTTPEATAPALFHRHTRLPTLITETETEIGTELEMGMEFWRGKALRKGLRARAVGEVYSAAKEDRIVRAPKTESPGKTNDLQS